MLDRALAVAARERHGLITADDLRSIGVSRAQVRSRIENGSLVRVNEHVLAIAGAPVSWAQTAAAALAAIPGSVLSHSAAARVHGLAGVAPEQQVVVSVGLHAYHQLAGTRIRRTRLLPDDHITIASGFAVTTVPRTLVDLGADLSDGRYRHVLDAALSTGRTTWDDLVSVLNVMGARGRPGIARVRRVLTAIEGEPPTESELERRYLRLLRQHGIALPQTQVTVPWAETEPGRVDAMFVEARSIIELDGRTWHRRSGAFEHDRTRDQLAVLAGFRTARITHRQLEADVEQVLAVTRTLATPLHR